MATKLNYSVSLDGSTDAFSIADHADFKPTGAFTVGGWVKINATTDYRFIFNSSVSSQGIWFNIDPYHKVDFLVGTNVNWNRVTGNTALNDGNWHFVVGVWDGSYIYVYVDGVLDATPVARSSVNYNASNVVRVGEAWASNYRFGSNLKGVFMDNGNAWTQAQIATRMFQDLTSLITTGAYWKFENNANDSLAGGHNLTDIGTPTYVNTPEDVPHTYYLESTNDNLTSMKFDGSNDGLSITDHADLKPTGSFTVGAWVKTSTTGVYAGIVQSYSESSTYRGFLLQLSQYPNANIVRFIIGDGTSTFRAVYSTRTITDGNWHFIVGTWNGTNAKIYIDGIEDTNITNEGATPSYGATNYVRIGCQNIAGTNGESFPGYIRQTFLINGTAWSQSTIQSKMFVRLASTETNIKLLLHLDGTLTDSSGNSHDASLIDAPYYSPNVPFDARGARQSIKLVSASSQAVSVVDHADLKPTGAFTLGGWFKTSTTGAYQFIFQSYSVASDQDAGITLHVGSDNKVHFTSGKNTGITPDTDLKDISSSSTYTDGAWHFAVGTWNTTNLYLYVDGSQVATASWANAPTYQATNYVRVGCVNQTGTNAYFMNGKIRGAFLVNGAAWDSSKVSSYTTRNIDPTETNLKLLLNLDNNYIDRSGNAHYGTAIATPTFSWIVPYDGLYSSFSSTLTETVVLTDGIIRGISQSKTETLVLTPTFTGVKIIDKVYSEILTLTGSIARQIYRSISNTITLVDTKTSSMSHSFSEILTLVDTFVTNFVTAIELSEILILADTFIKKITGKILTETVVLADTFSRNIMKFLTLLETLVLTDSLAITKTISKTISEVISFIDTITNYVRYALKPIITGTKTLISKMTTLVFKPKQSTKTLS